MIILLAQKHKWLYISLCRERYFRRIQWFITNLGLGARKWKTSIFYPLSSVGWVKQYIKPRKENSREKHFLKALDNSGSFVIEYR